MTTELIGAAIFVVTVIFAAGKIVNSSQKEMAQTKLDINRVGAKLREVEKAAERRNHNICMVLMAVTENKEDRFKIAGLLREDN